MGYPKSKPGKRNGAALLILAIVLLVSGAIAFFIPIAAMEQELRQDVESYDRATALESAGWQMVTMAPQLWRALNGVKA